MQIKSDSEMRALRRSRSVVDEKGERLKPVKKLIKPLAMEDRQAMALENIVTEIKQVLQSNNANATVLLEMIRKIQVEPEPRKLIKELTVERDVKGFAKRIIPIYYKD